ncbi:Uma2 family endonuclease [Nocardia sp. NPDC050712]|uniref:Uma2 family endonuclease n=1 Tax=Nocardia sp. NPDC050712 TaxID=3155518 RepID=UPI00340FBAF2
MAVVEREPEQRLTAAEFLAAEPGELAQRFGGRFEINDGLVVRCMAQSEVHGRVIRRLGTALEDAVPAGACFEVADDVAVRFADAESVEADRRLNVRYPDLYVRNCGAYDVNTVLDGIELAVEVVSSDSGYRDTVVKHALYARAGIPVYLIVFLTDDGLMIDRIEEFRLDWSGRRYSLHASHDNGELVLDQPIKLVVPFSRLDLVTR